MKCFFVLSALLVAVPSGTHGIGDAWSNFKISHAREYDSPHEELRRQQIFHQNLKKIEEHNARYAAGEVSWYMGVNKFTDMTPEEFVEYQNPSLISNEDDFPYQTKEAVKPSGLRANPGMVDYRYAFSDGIINQGSCGSCYAIAVTNVLAAHSFIHKRLQLILSPQNLVDCSIVSPYNNSGCNGGQIENAMTYVLDHGVMLAQDYPYNNSVGTCRYDSNLRAPISVSYFVNMANDNQELEDNLAQEGPIAVSIDAKEWQFYDGGIFHPTIRFKSITHAVTLVGYGTTYNTLKNYWLIRNSWGPEWGEDGYIRVDRDLKLPFGIGLGDGFIGNYTRIFPVLK